MPRMAVVGDLDLDETLGALLDPLGAGAAIPPAADPMRRLFRLAQFIPQAMKALDRHVPSGAALLRLARADRDGDGPAAGRGYRSRSAVAGTGHADRSATWPGTGRRTPRCSTPSKQMWLAELAARGEVDAPTRRNLLFARAAERWRAEPPATPIVAAGVTSAAPALAELLRVVSELPQGAVILPDLDLSMSAEVWDELGRAGRARAGDPPFARGDAVTHPQYHLKLLLNRMGVARGEVQPWHRAGLGNGPPERSHAISNLFLPPEASEGLGRPARRQAPPGGRADRWRRANPEEEAQAVALLVREALEEPERRVALVTPDRGLAAARGRIIARAGTSRPTIPPGGRCRRPPPGGCCCCWPKSLPNRPRRCR